MVYAGHQFGNFVPQLGDGRAILLGEVLDRNGERRDVQLKGAGRTPFSRNGDGRAALGPVLREYLVSEAMHALGIPTTRALAAVSTGETVYRDRPLRGAVLTRVASSHIRVGTFQFFAARGDAEAVERLCDYVIDRHFPDILGTERPSLALLQAIAERQARLIARWMNVGFIHGVMNTDNTALSGETIDFGPCAFMNAYDPATSFSAIDTFGRYAYANQPAIAQWNLSRFAETLLPFLHPDPERSVELANEAISLFATHY
jgi:serine/tyrosine/threonine adenylyltransferase